MAARVKSQAGGTDDGAALSIPSAFRNHLMLGATEAIMWIACRRHFSHEMIREHLERRGLNQRRRLHSGHVNCALQRRADKAQLELFRLIIGGVPATGTLDDEGHRDHKKRVPLPVEFLKDGAYIELLSGHLRADPLLEKHSGCQRPTYLNVSFDRDAFFKALAAAEPRSQATDDKPIELADAPTATGTPKLDPYHTGLPGKPTIGPLILEKFRKRVEAGTFHLTLAEEATALINWATSEHPEAAKPISRSVQNLIRDEYRAAKHALKQDST